MAAFQKLPSGNRRTLLRRKRTYTSETFRRRKDGEEWALDTERRIGRGESVSAKRPRHISTFGNLIDLHIANIHEVKKPLRRSKAYSLRKLKEHLGKSATNKLRREKLIEYGRFRAKEVPVSSRLEQSHLTSPPLLRMPVPFTVSPCRRNRSIWRGFAAYPEGKPIVF